MSHIRVLICRVDDPASDQLAELAAFDLPAADFSALRPDTTLDELETTRQLTTVASRFGTLTLSQQVCRHPERQGGESQ
jgi:hypothetical protein